MIRRAAARLRSTARYYSLRAQGLQWLFVLGHMRSGSTLLVHLLNSSEEILGYGETHLCYSGRHSLANLHDHVHRQFEKHGATPTKPYRYVMDKILWEKIYDKNVLCWSPLKVVVIVRNPEGALPSIISTGLEEVNTPIKALEYYSESLNRIDKEIKDYESPFVLVEYRNLVEKTDHVLKKISKYLGVLEPLTPEYDRIWSTGQSGIGDPSEKIQEGAVVPTQSSYEVEIEDNIMSAAREEYKRFLTSWGSGKDHIG